MKDGEMGRVELAGLPTWWEEGRGETRCEVSWDRPTKVRKEVLAAFGPLRSREGAGLKVQHLPMGRCRGGPLRSSTPNCPGVLTTEPCLKGCLVCVLFFFFYCTTWPTGS